MAIAKRAGMFLLACAICLAVWKSIPHDSRGLISWSETKVEQSRDGVEALGDEVKKRTKDIEKPQSIIPKTGNKNTKN